MEDFVTLCKARATEALNRFLHDLSFVPADKLTWKPAPTAKSAFEIAAHCAGYSLAFAGLIRTVTFPANVEDFLGPINARIESITTVEEAEAMLRTGIDETIAALDTVKPKQIDSVIEVHALGRTPFRFFMTLPAYHLETHGAQICYLQTCWGDLEVHL